MQILVFTRQNAAPFYRRGVTRQYRDAVPALLAVPYRFIACSAQSDQRKALCWRFELLKTCDVGLGLFEPTQESGQTRIDTIDVEGGDLHADISGKACLRRRRRFARSIFPARQFRAVFVYAGGT